jgi:GTP-binding protein
MSLKVAIVGRPNVGKSTLFNRLAGKKLAIVNDQPGVTRDRREAEGRIGDLDLELIDTAGFEDVADESLEARMRAQTERAIEDADVCLFVFDGREGVTPLDRIFADLVRRRNRPVILLANKAEGRAADIGAAEAYALGLGEALFISAEHGEGLAELYQELLPYAPDHGEEEEEDGDKAVRIAIVGRPNAGKSTLVNRLIGEDRLLTGPEAGITRDAIPVDWEYEGRAVRLVDTAGLRRRARVQETLEKLSTSDTIRAITFAEIVILVMDADNAFETQDLQIADLVEREGRGLIFCLAKWDLVEDPQARLAELRETAERMLPQVRGTPLIALSAETGRGVDRLMPAVFETHKNWSAKVKTKDLNDWLSMATQRHPPPAVNGRRIKPKYMAQMKGRPPTFVLMASRAEHLPEQYKRYLVNSLRESFDLPGVPIRIFIKSNKNPYADEAEGNRTVKNAKVYPTKPKKPAVDETAEPVPKRAMNRAAAAEVEVPPSPLVKPSRARKAPLGKSLVRKPGPAFAKPSTKKTQLTKGKATRTQQRTPTTHKLRKPPTRKPTPRSPPPKR